MSVRRPGLSRAFSWMGRLYPADVRARVGEDLARTASDVWTEARPRSVFARLMLGVRLVCDLLAGVVFAWLGRGLGKRPGRAGVWDGISTDVRLAFRGLRRQPLFAVATIGTLSLGIGGVTAFWSIFYGVLLKPLPYHDADQLVRVWDHLRASTSNSEPYFAVTDAEYLAWAGASRTLETVAAGSFGERTIEGTEYPLRIPAGLVTHNFFSVLGIEPALGRGFRTGENDVGRKPVVVLSHALWRSAFGGDSAIVGRVLRVNGEEHTVVGIAPAGFEWLDKPDFHPNQPREWWTPQLWIPRVMDPSERSLHFLQVIGRVRPGFTTEQVAEDLGRLNAGVHEPEDSPEAQPTSLVTVEWLADALYAPIREPVILPLMAMALVLIIACANVASLMLSRLPVRVPELALRGALGASRGRLTRQLAVEALVLSAVAAGFGAALAAVGTRVVARLGPQEIPRLADAHVDGVALAFTLAIATACAIAVGLVPAWRGAQLSAAGAMSTAIRRRVGITRSTGRAVLLAGQLAIALVLLVSAGLLVRSFGRLMSVELGFEPEGLVAASVSPFENRFVESLGSPQGAGRIVRNRPEWVGFWTEAIQRLEADPRVESAAAAVFSLLWGGGGSGRLRLEGQDQVPDTPGEDWSGTQDFISPGYFATVGVPLRRGRDFDTRDQAGAPAVAIVNETLARRYWPGVDAVGRRFWGEDMSFDGRKLESTPRLVEVVGIVADIRERQYAEPPLPAVYWPMAQVMNARRASQPRLNFRLLVRGEDEQHSLALIQQVVKDLDARSPVAYASTLDALVDRQIRVPRFFTVLFSILAVLATGMAAAGVFATLAFMVSQRTHEIGVRMALGARRSNVVGLVVRQVTAVTALGLALGVWGAASASKLLTAWLYQVQPSDLGSFLGAAGLLLVTAVAAAWLPASRAASIDPAVTLKAE